MIGAEAEIDALEVAETAQKQSGACQQQQGERHLRDHQALAHKHVRAARDNSARLLFHGRCKVGARSLERRREAKYYSAEERYGGGEGENAPIGIGRKRRRVIGKRQKREKRAPAPYRYQYAQRAACRCENQPFGQNLADDIAPSSAHRQPDRDLLLPPGCARDHQIRDVGAGDQQYKTNQAHEQRQRLAK